jgi:DNA-binding beta-propeller fold protein YncE
MLAWTLRLLPLALAIACQPGGEDTDPVDTDTEPGVMRDCPETVGVICPFVGTGASGFNGDGRHRLDTWLSMPMSITFSPYGLPVIADWNNHKLRIVEEDDTLRTIMGTNFLGDGDIEQLDMAEGAQGTEVNLNHPTQQRYFSSGVLLSASWHTHKLRTWNPITGITRVLIGGAYGFRPPDDEAPGTFLSAVGAELNQPRWVEIDSVGDIYVLDMRNERIRKIDMANWQIGTLAGSGAKGIAGTVTGEVDCTSEEAQETCFAFPDNMNPEPGGAMQLSADETRIYIADSEAHIIRVLDLVTQKVTLLSGEPGVAGDVDGPVADALFSYPAGLALDHATDTLFVADTNNHKIRAIDLATGMVTTFAGTGEPTCPSPDPTSPVTCPDQYAAGDGGPAVDATLFRPFGVDLDLDGNIVIADSFNHRFRTVYR